MFLPISTLYQFLRLFILQKSYVEPLVLDHLVNGQAPSRVLDQHSAKEVLALLAQVLNLWVSGV